MAAPAAIGSQPNTTWWTVAGALDGATVEVRTEDSSPRRVILQINPGGRSTLLSASAARRVAGGLLEAAQAAERHARDQNPKEATR